MAKKIKLNVLENKIIISGEINSILYQGSQIKAWLKSAYNLLKIEDNVIEIYDDSFLEEDSLNEFKETLEGLSQVLDIEIIFEKSFNSKINIYIEEEKKFNEFSNYALSIWENKYETEHFKKFSTIVKEKLSERTLYRLQLLSSYHLAFSQNACNFSVPGAGKTSIVYGAYSYLNSLNKEDSKYVDKLLVIGPPSSFKPWEEEFEECFGLKANAIRLNGETEIDKRIDALSGKINNPYNLLLITYQSVPILIEYLLNFCKSNNVMIICDEAHKIKNLDGIWSENVLSLAPYAKSRVILTGTPVPNGYEDLVNLFKFIYPSRDIVGFRADSLKRLNSNPYSSDVLELIENIKPFFIRIKKSDLNLPEITLDKSLGYGSSDLEKRIYSKLLEASESFTNDVNKMGLHLRLVQSIYNPALLVKTNNDSHGFFDYSDSQINIKEILGDELFSEIENLDDNFNPSRHFKVANLTKQLIDNGEKVVIWGYFIDSIKRLNRLLRSLGLNGEIVIGETKKQLSNSESLEITREKIIDSFKQENGGIDYIITNPIVLGESISLHKVCHHSIYFELSYSAAPYIQSRDRIHRVYLKNGKQVNYKTHYYHYISDPIFENQQNIDEIIFNVLKRKEARMLDIIEDEIPLLTEEISENEERLITINKIISEYRKSKY